MKGLFLYGIYCRQDIWRELEPLLSDFDIEYVEYPRAVTQAARSAADIGQWVYAHYGSNRYDFLVGHSMGGIVALELAAKLGLPCRQLILIESNLKPAEAFYRNLLTPEHMQAYGDQILQSLRAEAHHYLPELGQSLQENFDFTCDALAAEPEIHAIYGDRGQPEYPNRISDLRLGPAVIDRIRFWFVEDSCHLPMIENPAGLAEILRSIVLQQKTKRCVSDGSQA